MRPPLEILLLAVLFATYAPSQSSPSACAPCHRRETEAFVRSGMARALESGETTQILQENQKLSVDIGGYSYKILRVDNQSIYTVTDGKESFRAPIDWAFGQGSAGQTYFFRREGRWYESRVSYFFALSGLDVTMGAQTATPHNLMEAAGRATELADVAQCFDCHATNVLKKFEFAGMIPGIQCERCHGATEAHLQRKSSMRPLRKLDTEEMSEFCGECHRTWSQIAINGPRGLQNVRFQPYRLSTSKCYDTADARIRCTACHDPHRPLETSVAAYDGKCKACHSASNSARRCRTGTKDCVVCHMPKVELPGAHTKFTDHRIRIAMANDPYPD